MAITKEELQMIEAIGLRKHIQIIDGYIATGLDIDDITIHYAIDQASIAMILHGYGFGLGLLYGDEFDSKKKYKGVPFPLVEEFVTACFPGFQNDEKVELNTIDHYLDLHDPNWKNHLMKYKGNMFSLSEDELQGNIALNPSTEKKEKKLLNILKKLRK